jgi:hypothetical protein
MAKLLKFTIHGSFHTSDNKVIDFEDLQGVVPYTDIDIAKMHIRSRYAVKWIREAVDADGNKAYPERIENIRQVFIDEPEEVEGELSFIGKDIREMNENELQDLATAKDLRRVPVPRHVSGQSIQEMRIAAYANYYAVVYGVDIDVSKEGFTLSNQEPCIVGDGVLTSPANTTNDEYLNNVEDDSGKPTMAELVSLAREKGIKHHVNIKYDNLYERLFGETAA